MQSTGVFGRCSHDDRSPIPYRDRWIHPQHQQTARGAAAMTIEARFHIAIGAFTLDVDLNIPARGITALSGPSGCGKTTLLRAIAGLDHHRDGYCKVGEMIWQDAGSFIPPHRRELGFVFQESSLLEHLTVRRNLEYGASRVPQSGRTIAMEDVVEFLGIGPLLERKPDRLSGGERQRVAIGRALAVSPKILLLDEPLTGLDEASKQEMMPYLESLHDELKIPVLYVTHTLTEIARMADRLVLMEAGRIVEAGALQDMLTRLDLPTARGSEAAAIIEAVVTGYDRQFHLTRLDFAGGECRVPGIQRDIGAHVRLRIAARDVSLTLERQFNTSILNIFSATVDDISDEEGGQVTVRLAVGGVPVLARITKKSVSDLGVKPGSAVFAQVKSVSLLS
jgi:molybdate transport system ATP-binding protein